MNKTWLIIQREFLIRVQKKSFLIATILVPLIFPAIIGVFGYIVYKEEQSAKPKIVYVLDETGRFNFESSSRFNMVKEAPPLDSAKKRYQKTDDFALLYIPQSNIENPTGITIYTKENQSMERIGSIERMISDQVKDFKMEKYNVEKEALKDIRSTSVDVKTINLTDTGEEKSSNSAIFYGLGLTLGVLIYMFVLIYGIQIMQGVIDEKTSKIVEVIVSSVKPFQLMLGKIIGIASVGLLQFLIWIVLITALSTAMLSYFGLQMPQKQMMEQVTQNADDEVREAIEKQGTGKAQEFLNNMGEIPFGKIAFVFVFYFLGGYLLYGALFAAVGSAVESLQESQQFQFPVTMPLLIGYLGLFTFVLRDPNGPVSFWLSIIPFTSPVAMVGRIAFDVPTWQLILSMALLVVGFIFTTWLAGRIYRVGILMTGTKVNYKVLAKWFMQKG
ncbi:MAG: ABC transporter permease [Cyclobacteriaceae bacterium]|nr:ABC transporter permease [Cyclobacteriaceae bacterium]